MSMKEVGREPLLRAEEREAWGPEPTQRPVRSSWKRGVAGTLVALGLIMVWSSMISGPNDKHRSAEAKWHTCGDSWLDTMRDSFRWDRIECSMRGQSHGDACNLSYEERNRRDEATLMSVPRAASARAKLQEYTQKHHLAGENADYVSTLHQIQQWSELLHLPKVQDASELIYDAGSAESQALWKETHNRTEKQPAPRVWADTYSTWLDQPINASVALVHANSEKVIHEFDLAEHVLEEDYTSKRGMPPFHGYSFSGTAQGALVYAGAGHKADFELLQRRGIDFHGKIVLVRYGEMFRGLKVRAAQEAGAAGVLIYTDLKEDDSVTEANGYEAYPKGPAREPSSVQRGSVQALSIYPGDPSTPGKPSYRNASRIAIEDADPMPHIPSIPISYLNAKRLLASLQGHGFNVADAGDDLPGAIPDVEYWSGPSEEHVRMDNQMDLKTRDIWNVYAVIPGAVDDQRIVIGNHRDAWTFGGVDPSSGTAVVHEVIKAFGQLVQQGWKPMRTIVFAAWDAEEYGLVGSTEFGEDYSEHIQKNVAMYLNLDMAVSGSKLEGNASPSLATLLREAAADIRDPNQPTKAMNFGHIGALGSGSDFTVFLQRLGVASLDVSYARTVGDPVYHYHSNYDSFHWVDKFGDRDFARHEAIAKLFGLMAFRASQQAFLPIDVEAYAQEMFTYYDQVLQAAQGRNTASIERLHATIQQVARNAKHLAEVQKQLGHRFRRLLKQESLHPPSEKLREVMREVRQMNLKLRNFEQGFLDDNGLPERTWYRHLGVAPGRWLGYGATTFPGVVEGYTLDHGKHAEMELRRLDHALHRIAEGLQWP
ncbi:glutamate carboxypeptidase II [Malassezia yamatoensis]|uniref:Glutamate carboxypeptidase II n=1 Tax=Malassezia yamatoensis TaxID=253288 RepID=A0AAJ6CFR5_9BASI|nr:glutamate carboxypeptidase II [Malassezia yamatoensis]